MKLILLPGLDGTGRLFDRFVAQLDAEIEAVVVEYPTEYVYSYPDHVEYAMSVLPLDEAYVVLGESFSGPVAVAIAARQPAGLVGLVLCCSFVKCPVPVPRFTGYFLFLCPVRSIPNVLIARLLLQQPVDHGILADINRAIASVSVTTLRARLRAVLDVDVSSELSSLPLPVLNLTGGQDVLVRPRTSARLVSLCKDTREVCLPGPHALLQCEPAASAACIQQFVHQLG